jgi:tRNA A37 threonylcarbamoyladenosine synthetase subunit TsaC/SUA5/YrdC
MPPAKNTMTDTVYLTQTDTTIGFLSQDADRLTQIKQRPPHKHYIKAVDSLATLKAHTRIPSKYKNRIRRAHKSTFILPNGASYRVIRDSEHLGLISQLGWAYSTSANLSNKPYDEQWARSMADEVIEPLESKGSPSSIYKINNKSIQKIR